MLVAWKKVPDNAYLEALELIASKERTFYNLVSAIKFVHNAKLVKDYPHIHFRWMEHQNR